MFYVAELSQRAVIGDRVGCRVWYATHAQAQEKAMALQLNNDDMQFAVVPLANPGNASLKTLCVEMKNPLKVRL